MLKKMTLLAAALAAFVAFAVPAVAQAAITDPATGEAAEEVTATSSNTLTTTPNATWDCDTQHLVLGYTGATGHYSGSGEAYGHKGDHKKTSECVFAGTNVTIKYTSFSFALNITGGGNGSATFSYAYDITHPTFGTAHCTFHGTNVPVTYKATNDEINVNGNLIGTGGHPACPTTGSINGDFTVTNLAGAAVSIH